MASTSARGRFAPIYLKLVAEDAQVGQPLQESLLSRIAERLTGRVAA